MIRTSLLCIILCACLFATTAFAKAKWQISSTLNSDIYTQAQPVKAFADDFDGELRDGDTAFTFNQFDITVKRDALAISVFSRFDYVIKHHPETALYTFEEKNDLPFSKNQYRYNINAVNTTSHGVAASYDFKPFADIPLRVTPRLNVFGSKHFQDGDIVGTLNPNDDSADLTVDYGFSKDRLFKTFSPDERPEGMGVSVDLQLNWQVSPEFLIYFHGKDLLSKVSYKDAGFTIGRTTSEPATVTGEQVSKTPAALFNTSFNGNTLDRDVTLPRRYLLGLDYHFNDFAKVGAEVRHIAGLNLLKGHIGAEFAPNWHAQLGYELETKAISVMLSHTYFRLELASDTFSEDDARYLQLGVSTIWPF